MSLSLKPAVLMAAMIALAPVPALAAFACPASGPAAGGEDPAMASLPITADDLTVTAAGMTAIDRLRLKGLPNGQIVDQVVQAYCGHVAKQSGLSDAARDGRVRRFAADVAAVVYSQSQAKQEDIILNLPVPTTLYDSLSQAARTEKVTQDAWVLAAIKRHLATGAK